MIETILNYLNARLATLGRIDTTYCLTERRKREGEAVDTIPYAYTGGGEFRPVDVDNGSSAWWRARTGWSKEPVTVVGRAVKQQRGTYPLRLFVLLRRKDSVSDDAMMPARLADDLSELLNFENGDLQVMLNADTVSVRASNADPDTTRTYQEEFSTPVADLDYRLCMVAVDVTVDVTGDYKCWQGECDTDPDILRLFNFCDGSVAARLTPEQVECLQSAFPTPCEDATFTLEDTNGNTLGSGSIPSGGSDVIVAPDSSWALEDTAGGPLGSGSILSGGSDTIVAPDAAWALEDTAGTNISSGSILSNGSDVIVAPDAAWTLQNTAGGTLGSGLIVSNGSDVIVAPDATVGINGNAGLFTVPSGSPINIGVEDSDGNPTGAFDPNTNSWVIPPCPPSGASLAVAVSDTTPDAGDTITITATPSSGFVPTEYLFFAFDGTDVVHIPTPNINDSTANWTVSLAGNVGLYVLATDGVSETWGVVNIIATLCSDTDASAYIAAVEAADGFELENRVKLAICQFVTGCKVDGNWNAIKASCILAGARTLAGALVPLAGTAPNSFNFVSADYNRKNGLKGNASNKFIDTLRANNADGQDDNHNALFLTESGTGGSGYMAGNDGEFEVGPNSILRLADGTGVRFRSRNLTGYEASGFQDATGFMGMSRNNSATFDVRIGGSSFTGTVASQAPNAPNIHVFKRNNPPVPIWTNARIAFYSIGEAVDLPALDARVTTLMNDLNAAIP